MPSNQGHGNEQRRIFRGKGGATDGRLPPKKTPRVKVKYQPANSDARGEDSTRFETAADLEEEHHSDEGLDLELHQLDIKEDPLIKEIKHLQKRVLNVQTSLQLSKGLPNPQIWYNNCLLPVKNAVKEWRSICKFHLSEENTASEYAHHQDAINQAAVQVYTLLQMAMQSGPLTGSNPGYFKRCGGEVASIALMFLNEIVGLAGIDEILNSPKADVDETIEGTCDNDEECLNVATSLDQILEESDTSSSCSSNDSSQSDCSDSVACDAELSDVNREMLLPPDPSQSQVTRALQTSMKFSEKQSQQIYHWIQSAEKAAAAKKDPSKSSKKLQSQRSKKQRMKELKLERKLKKTKKKGGGK
jgi:hypothetical protein